MLASRSLWLIVLMGWAALGGAAAQAQDMGTLVFLDLPESTTVRLDGTVVALDRSVQRGQSVDHPAGRIQVSVEGPDGTARVAADVAAGSVTTLQYREGVFDAKRSAVALVLPGVPQLRGERALVGGAIVLGLAGAVGGTVWTSGQMSDARSDADAAVAQYSSAGTEAEVAAARAEHALAVEAAESARTVRAAFVAAGVAVYAASAIDAFLNHARSATLSASAPRRSIVSVRPSGTGVALRIRL